MVQIFKRLAQGETLNSICYDLNSREILSTSRYTSPKPQDKYIKWLPSRISKLVHNTSYIGQHIIKAQSGPIIQQNPNLIDTQTFYKAQEALIRNRTLQPNKRTGYVHLLKGIIRCQCGTSYVAQKLLSPRKSGRKFAGYYYCCSSRFISSKVSKPKCQSAYVKADEVEKTVWDICKTILTNPDEMFALAEKEIKTISSPDISNKHHADLAKFQEARQTYMKLIDSGTLSYADAENHLSRLNKEEYRIKLELENLRIQSELRFTYQDQLNRAKVIIKEAQNRINLIEAAPELSESRLLKQQIIRALVRGITVITTGEVKGKRQHELKIELVIGKHTDFNQFLRC